MKLPFTKDDNEKKMSGSSTSRRELIHEIRETSLMSGNGVQKREMVDKSVMVNVDLGSGDNSEYASDGKNHESYASVFHSNLQTHQSFIETPLTNVVAVGSSSVPFVPPPPPPPLSTPPIDVLNETSSERLDSWTLNDNSNSYTLFKEKDNKFKHSKDSAFILMEEKRRPHFKVNESNPAIPSPKQTSKTSTLRLLDRRRSESEDDIEKADDSEPDGSINDQKVLHKLKADTEDSPNSKKMDKNGNKSDADSNEVDNDCIVQCLYYTIQCCECVTF